MPWRRRSPRLRFRLRHFNVYDEMGTPWLFLRKSGHTLAPDKRDPGRVLCVARLAPRCDAPPTPTYSLNSTLTSQVAECCRRCVPRLQCQRRS
eukprot:SM000020S06024  [mRNA]  locus=s20:502405:503138:+ [translate_table: standard]